jgi:ketosteroid isomerase-like protein
MPHVNEQLIRDYFAAWNARDGAKLASCFAEAGTFEGPTTRMPIHAFDLHAVMESLAAQFSKFEFDVTRITADSLAHAEWVFRGTNDGAISRGVPATGKTL